MFDLFSMERGKTIIPKCKSQQFIPNSKDRWLQGGQMLIQDLFFKADLQGWILARGIVIQLFMIFFGRSLEFANKKRLFYCRSRRRAFLKIPAVGSLLPTSWPLSSKYFWILDLFSLFIIQFTAQNTDFLEEAHVFQEWRPASCGARGSHQAYCCLLRLELLCSESCNRAKYRKLQGWSLQFVELMSCCHFPVAAS